MHAGAGPQCAENLKAVAVASAALHTGAGQQLAVVGIAQAGAVGHRGLQRGVPSPVDDGIGLNADEMKAAAVGAEEAHGRLGLLEQADLVDLEHRQADAVTCPKQAALRPAAAGAAPPPK